MKARFTILLTLFLGSIVSIPALAVAEVNPEAQRHFDAGLAYADDPSGPKWEEALTEFHAAYAINPTWKLKNNIGLCSLHLERDGEAIQAYKEYLAHGGEKDLSAKHRKQIERDIEMLSASLVHVTIEVAPAEAVVIDERKNSKGEMRRNRYPVKGGKASLGLHPGTHRITVEAKGYASDSWSLEGNPASTHQHQFKLEPEKNAEPTTPLEPTKQQPPAVKESARPLAARTPTSVYVGLGVTAGLVAATAVTGVMALNKNKEYADSSSLDERDRLKEAGETFVLLTDIGAGAAVLSTGITAYLYFTERRAASARSAKTPIRFSPVAGPNAAGLALSGKF